MPKEGRTLYACQKKDVRSTHAKNKEIRGTQRGVPSYFLGIMMVYFRNCKCNIKKKSDKNMKCTQYITKLDN